jgi:AraC-like DNA-binding protein
VRKYQIFRFLFDKGIIPPAKYHAPRPEHCITFYIRNVQQYSYSNSTAILAYPRCVINGMYTVPIYRYGGNDFLAIKVILQPSVLYQLVKFPLDELTNKFINAEDVWGPDVRSACDQLNELNDLHEMLLIVEAFFVNLVKKITIDFRPIDEVSSYILNTENGASLDWLANESCLSTRQFIRKFQERMGVSAKTFERVIRFDKAYRMKNSHPEYDWLYIAIACNYNDYQHLVKDFKEFTKLTPPSFFELEKRSPERSFGLFYRS